MCLRMDGWESFSLVSVSIIFIVETSLASEKLGSNVLKYACMKLNNNILV